MSAPLFLRNRFFFLRMRDEAYHKAYNRFRALGSQLKSPEQGEREALRNLDAFLAALEEAHDYACDAIRGLKRRQVGMYREDREKGILEEEVVLRHFLEEMLSNTRFLRARLTTDLKMRLYRRRLRRLQKQSPGGDGFIRPILASVDRLEETELVAIAKVLEMMDQRWLVGHGLFEVIRRRLPYPHGPQSPPLIPI